MTTTRSFPTSRPRRLRQHEFLRHLVAETRLSPHDLIAPLFVCENSEKQLNIPGMPGVQRIPLKQLAARAATIQKLGIPAIALFPVIPQQFKSKYSSEAHNPKGLIPRAIEIIKKKTPDLGVITDIALDPYSSDGQDGITNAAGTIINDATLDALCRQALCLAAAGSDIVAPSDMMDGRVGAIRAALDGNGYTDLPILAYTAKYASSLYGPFRSAIGSAKNLGKSNKLTYQMFPANSQEALYEAALDLQEGADMIMVKPGNMYADIIWRLHQECNAPVFAYQVSGEFSMLSHLGGTDPSQRAPVILESLVSLKRAGASAILTYFAEEAAALLK